MTKVGVGWGGGNGHRRLCAREQGVDAGEENKFVSFFFSFGVSMLLFPPSALRTAGFRNGSLGNRPSAPFRSNVYQPTEMAVVLNGGTVSIQR